MENPSTEMFHKLIRRNKSSHNNGANIISFNGKTLHTSHEQSKCFAQYYEDLALPKDNGYNSEYHELCNIRHSLINQISDNEMQNCDVFQKITPQEIREAITKLNSGKAADEFGLKAEHFKHAPAVVNNFLAAIFDKIFKIKTVPNIFKSGILTPVLKKSKNPAIMDNYRGITVTPIISKVFESTILPFLTVNFDQSSLQFGFTAGLSMLLAALIICESRIETKTLTFESLFLITLDSQKAFDVVDHIIMLDKFYEASTNLTLWSIVKDLYSGLTSKVKWMNSLSDSFDIKQGVRQGGILSPFLYKLYINNLLKNLESHRIGFNLGSIYVGCPTCADDIALLSSSPEELQCMLSVAARHAANDRVTLHPAKTKAVILNKSRNLDKSKLNWNLNGNTIYPSSDTTHLGIIRAEIKENDLNIESRISIARRTLYALINIGVHGYNGLNPMTSYKIYQCYVLPRLIYGLEILPLSTSQLSILSKFHLKNLRNFQSLPLRTATAAVYLLLGALPLEGEIHQRQLSFLYNILSCDNHTIQNLVDRQNVLNSDNPNSFFGKVTEILQLYCLPDIQALKQNLPSKMSWKFTFKTAIRKHWLQELLNEILGRTTLVNMNSKILQIGETHPVWSCLKSSVSEVKKGCIKARLLTGTYMLQSQKSKFSNGKESPVCKCCGTEDEDIVHFILTCPALHQQRKDLYQNIKQAVIQLMGESNWTAQFSTKTSIAKLIIDSSCLQVPGHNKKLLGNINRMTIDLCYKLHSHRTWILSK